MKLPLYLYPQFVNDALYSVRDELGIHLAHDLSKQDAELVIKAVNSHEILVNALIDIVAMAESGEFGAAGVAGVANLALIKAGLV